MPVAPVGNASSTHARAKFEPVVALVVPEETGVVIAPPVEVEEPLVLVPPDVVVPPEVPVLFVVVEPEVEPLPLVLPSIDQNTPCEGL
jgi:hypothetical protein